MPRKLKVWGTSHHFVGSSQARVVVATFTKKRARELLGMGRFVFDNYVAETGNREELKRALAKPETVIVVKSF